MNLQHALTAALRNPGRALLVGMSLARGHYYRIKFRVLGRRVFIGRRFRVTGKLDIRGPGTVIFGDDCYINCTYIQPTTPWTHTREAVIRFGNHVGLAGTRLGCRLSIEVGDDTGLSDSRILDTDFHDARATGDDRANTAGMAKKIVIGRNVWLGAGSMILKGVTIGDNAVVGAGSVVATSVRANSIVFGNPAKVIWNNSEASKAVDVRAET